MAPVNMHATSSKFSKRSVTTLQHHLASMPKHRDAAGAPLAHESMRKCLQRRERRTSRHLRARHRTVASAWRHSLWLSRISTEEREEATKMNHSPFTDVMRISKCSRQSIDEEVAYTSCRWTTNVWCVCFSRRKVYHTEAWCLPGLISGQEKTAMLVASEYHLKYSQSI